MLNYLTGSTISTVKIPGLTVEKPVAYDHCWPDQIDH